ncbi:MAG TPA: hypothetical protein VNE17_14435 [Nitrolancea sp.]|nr:hypothetical protein [Nitrolancea sp.]
MTTTAWVVLVLVVAVVVIAGIWLYLRSQRTKVLKEQFGPEYDRTVQQADKRREAEAELDSRRKRVEQLDIRPLTSADRSRFTNAWEALQPRFVDDPTTAVIDADALVGQLMEARGYPVGDFEQRAADISVDHPDVVSNYREAHRLAVLNANGSATTEEQRRAFVHYRKLFDELLGNAVPDRAQTGRVS